MLRDGEEVAVVEEVAVALHTDPPRLEVGDLEEQWLEHVDPPPDGIAPPCRWRSRREWVAS